MKSGCQDILREREREKSHLSSHKSIVLYYEIKIIGHSCTCLRQLPKWLIGIYSWSWYIGKDLLLNDSIYSKRIKIIWYFVEYICMQLLSHNIWVLQVCGVYSLREQLNTTFPEDNFLNKASWKYKYIEQKV